MLLGAMGADARLAAFLLQVSQRMEMAGQPPDDFHLRMSRAEIASYLGLKVETVSRTFTALEHRGWIRVNRKHVQIVDAAALQEAFERQAS